MAKAKEITGLDCEANVLDWADKVLRVRFGEILEKRETALHSQSIEGVHDMRERPDVCEARCAISRLC